MTIESISYRFLLGALIGLLATTDILGWWNYLELRTKVALAEEQTKYFDEALELAKTNATPGQITAYRKAIEIYYPSGSRQQRGSILDTIVERARERAIEEMIRMDKAVQDKQH